MTIVIICAYILLLVVIYKLYRGLTYYKLQYLEAEKLNDHYVKRIKESVNDLKDSKLGSMVDEIVSLRNKIYESREDSRKLLVLEQVLGSYEHALSSINSSIGTPGVTLSETCEAVSKLVKLTNDIK